jgi:hypothetical protein
LVALAMTLERLDQKASAAVYLRFLVSADTTLKTLGLQGRVAGGDADAFCDMEQDLPTLARAYCVMPVMLGAMPTDLARNLHAAHCLGRMAVAEVTLPGMEAVASFQLGCTKKPEFLPHLVALLASPDPSTRGAALASFCSVTHPTPDMSSHCPSAVPMVDPQKEQQDIDFWRNWWAVNREEIGKTVTLPDVAPPARFASAAQIRPTPREIPIEIRLQIELNRLGTRATHYHDPTGKMVNEPSGQFDAVALRLVADSDRAAWKEIAKRTQVKLDENDARSRDLINTARVAGLPPPQERLGALYQERLAVLKGALDQLQGRLSPDGWQGLLSALPKGAGISIQAPPQMPE